MTKTDLELRLKKLLVTFFDCKANVINEETDFITQFGIDSLGVVSLICLIEDSFEIKSLDPSAYFHLTTYKKLRDYLYEKENLQ